MKKVFIVAGAVIVLAVIGRVFWAYQQVKSNGEQIVPHPSLQENRQNTNSFLLTGSTTSPQNEASSDWHTYTNDKYGFALTFPDSWKGYSVTEESNSSGNRVAFGINDQRMVFGIGIYTKQAWTDLQKEATQYGGPVPTEFIAENSEYVFTEISAQDFTVDVLELAKLRHSIVATFTFTK